MIQPIIKDISSIELDEPLETFIPEALESFCIPVQIDVGRSDSSGTDIFSIRICTPEWLIKNHKKEEIIIGRHYLIVFEYNFKRIKDRLDSVCLSCASETWEECVQKLSRLGFWEFEDFKETSML